MTPPATGRSPVAGSLGAALIALAAAAAIEFALYPSSGAGPVWVLDQFTVAGLVYVTAGLVAWWRRPSNQLTAVATNPLTNTIYVTNALSNTVSVISG